MLSFNFIGFAEGYLMRDLGLAWLLPIAWDGIGRGAAESAGFMIAKLMTLWRPLWFFRNVRWYKLENAHTKVGQHPLKKTSNFG